MILTEHPSWRGVPAEVKASLLRHAVEQQLREAGDRSYIQFQLPATR
ncbi:hypothetical protein [Streptomyces antimycoticus]|nr:hypothetical protein [Streptomyces antimycoticus]